jgi:outer membrane immunogenic protein
MKMIKSTIAMAVLALCAGSVLPSQAADIYRRSDAGSFKDAPVDYTPPIVWTGFYVGANLGGAFGDDDFNGIARAFDEDGQLIGGFHLGYNWQRSNGVVLGLEGDLNFSDGINYLSTLRARLGFAFGSVLLYGTGGLAFAEFNDTLIKDETQIGYVLGGGLEAKANQNLSFGLEALYHGFEDVDLRAPFADEDITMWSIRARMTFHTN